MIDTISLCFKSFSRGRTRNILAPQNNPSEREKMKEKDRDTVIQIEKFIWQVRVEKVN